MQNSLAKNPSIEELLRLGNENSQHRFAPLTSVDVERSFSMLKHILTSSRSSLTEDNFKKLAICYFNAYPLSEDQVEV